MKRKLKLPRLLRLTLVFLIAIVFQNCSEQKIKESTDETLNITEYLRDNPDYSMFLEILDITNYASFMNTYGAYTIFIPTNEAVKQYLTDTGAASLNDVPLEELQNLAKVHIIDQKINTNSFTDGKIPSPTLQGQYLLTGVANVNGASSVTINKTSKIVASNVELGNGVAHIVDKVLRYADKTLSQTIEADSNLSLFTEVLKVTGWYEKLNKPLATIIVNETELKVGHLTVLAQTNDVFEKAGLGTLEKIRARYSKPIGADPADPTKATDSLNLFVQYHVIPNINYLSDFATTPVFVTAAPLEVISSKLKGQDILLNEDVFNGVLEKGVGIIRSSSDVTCSNGVLHYVDGNFAIKKRLPMPVYFDLCDQPEMIANVGNYRKSGGQSFSFNNDGKLSEVTWVGSGTITWAPVSTAVNGDLFGIFRFRSSSNGNNNIEFTTPVIIKGRYKVWLSYAQHPRASPGTQVLFNGEPTSRLVNQQEMPNDPNNTTTGLGDRVLESQGYKRYVFPHEQSSRLYSRLAGIIDVQTTGRHKVMLISSSCSGCGGNGADRLDMLEFRPIEMDQVWPKFRKGYPVDGTSNLVYREDVMTDNGPN